jgi:hypothetical protein
MTELDLSSGFEKPRIESAFRSKCAVCGEWIEEGDWIVKNEDEEWIHEDCDD